MFSYIGILYSLIVGFFYAYLKAHRWGLDRTSFDGTDKEIAQHVAGTAAENNWDEKSAIICLAHDGNSLRGTTCHFCIY